ncbi:hypothetical protein QUW15_13920 [Desulfovibrio piger]|nr:hypothetical protein [Desulfovibrio piger]
MRLRYGQREVFCPQIASVLMGRNDILTIGCMHGIAEIRHISKSDNQLRLHLFKAHFNDNPFAVQTVTNACPTGCQRELGDKDRHFAEGTAMCPTEAEGDLFQKKRHSLPQSRVIPFFPHTVLHD